MKRIILFLSIILASNGWLLANHWTPVSTPYESNMTLTGIVQINGVEQQSPTLEVGAFCGTECRGSGILAYFTPMQRYVIQMLVYGEAGDPLTFKLFDHSLNQELDLVSPEGVAFSDNGYGSLNNPYVLNFVTTYDITVSANPAEGGMVLGAGTYVQGTTATLAATPNEGYTFINWTLGSEVVSNSQTYTFTVTESASYVAHFSNNHWTPNSTLYELNMTLTGIIQINDVEQLNAAFEVGVFCGEECRGTAKPIYFIPTQHHIVQLVIYGETGDQLTFKLFDHNSNEELELASPDAVTFTTDGYGSLANPYVLNFLEIHDITASANPAEGGNVEGADSYNHFSTCTLTATANMGYTFQNWIENGEVVSTENPYSFVVTEDRAIVANFVVSGSSDHEYVDLGLPSGLLWATCNIGANSPEEYGNYFAWGETQPKNSYYWSTYQYCMGDANTLTKYCDNPDYGYNGFTDNLTILLPEDDAATANWGTEWRMATQEEWQELLDNTIQEWTTQNGVNGRLFTAANGASLFLPTAGYRWGDDLFGADGSGYYWSSSLYTGSPRNAWYFSFHLGRYYVDDDYYRSDGRSVRAVRSMSQNFALVTVTPNPAEGGMVTGAGTYNYGETCTLTATANTGYTFINWTLSDEVVSTEAVYSFTVTQSGDYVANFVSTETHWTVDPTLYPDNMSITGIIQIDGIEQFSEVLELGAFCDGECRGTAMSVFQPNFERCFVYLTVYGEDGDIISFRLFDHATGQEVNIDCASTITFEMDAIIGDLIEPYVFNFVGSITQTTNFSNGWNWWSGYVELDGASSLQSLESGLGSNGVMIKSQNDGYASYLAGFGWYGSLSSINNKSTYQVKTSAACTVEMTGSTANPADYPITLNSGWTWIGYPVNAIMSVADAMSGITPQSGDMLKSQNNGYASYLEGFGWYGSLNTLQPGMGLMFKSNNGSAVTLVYPNSGTRTNLKANQTTEKNHWQPNLNAYPDNMSVMAVVELDGVELQGENYELAVFANGEVRGSARLMYVEPLNRYMAFLTVEGDEVSELYFGLYNAETDEKCLDSDNVITYLTNAVVGSFAEPYVVRFRGTTGMDETDIRFYVYPNPAISTMTISCETEFYYTMFDGLGQQVASGNGQGTQKVNVSGMAKGVYFLRLTTGTQTTVQKIVVE